MVWTVEAQMSADPTMNHEYLALDGLRSFLDLSSKLILGDSSLAISQDRVKYHCIVIVVLLLGKEGVVNICRLQSWTLFARILFAILRFQSPIA